MKCVWRGCPNCEFAKHCRLLCPKSFLRKTNNASIQNTSRKSWGNRTKRDWLADSSLDALPSLPASKPAYSDNELPILGTAICILSQAPGQVAGQLRALCDPGSQINLITRESEIHVKLKIEPCKQLISGIGLSSPFFAHGLVDCFLSHRLELNRKTPIRFLVVPKITGCNPQSLFTQPPLKPITKDELADSTYNEPGEINALIGVAT